MKILAGTITILLGMTALSAQAPPASDGGYTAGVRTRWNSIKRNVAASAQLMPEVNYAFKPTPEVRSFGELIGHLANEHYIFCSLLRNEKNPQEAVDFEKRTAKADLVKAINDSIVYCDAAYAAVKDDAKTIAPLSATRRDTPFSTMLLNVTHDSEHYGNLVTYLRLKGIVPPSSQPSR
jgi:uncharacterized damage-inducible protein DinB